ncbi:MAG: hypothetical protein EOP11_13435 [Proteobacteria bacterium]|nr:MAG: hypothetical protein EOP11_13435 [Pseudomonadota bacterium]
MENITAGPVGSERVKWGLKLRFLPESNSFEVNISLPAGEEENLPNLLEENIVKAFPEMLKALGTGRLPGNELDLSAKA